MTGKIRRFGVIGWPVAHSLSPLIYNHWLAENSIDGKYEKIAVKPSGLPKFIEQLAENNFSGLNITIPHKQAVYELAVQRGEKIDAIAEQARSVNMISVQDNGKFSAYSTDGIGFWNYFRQRLPDRQVEGCVVILGAGGAALALGCQLARNKVRHFRLINRTLSHAEKLAAQLRRIDKNIKVEIFDWAQRGHALKGAHLLIQTTPLGMIGQPALDLDLALLPPQAAIADIVYQPCMTPLLAAAKARGHPVIDGIGMLIHQAAPAFELWFGKKPHITNTLWQKLEQALSVEK